MTNVLQGNALILDLEAERRPLYSKLNNFHGHCFIWCMLQNYGGTMNLYGALDLVNNVFSSFLFSLIMLVIKSVNFKI